MIDPTTLRSALHADWRSDTHTARQRWQRCMDMCVTQNMWIGEHVWVVGTRQLRLGDGYFCSFHFSPYQPALHDPASPNAKHSHNKCCDKVMFYPCLPLAGKEAANPLNKWSNISNRLALSLYLWTLYCMWSIIRALLALSREAGNLNELGEYQIQT